MAGSEVDKDLDSVVSRPLWEPRHEWESRVMFVEDHVAEYGLEKAVNLSLVWANMKFLDCRYPQETEAMVAGYPLPSLEELRAKRKHKAKAVSSSSSSKGVQPKFEEVSALLSSIHTQSSIKATPPLLQAIANEMCLCNGCLGVSESESYSNKGMKVLESYERNTKKKFEVKNESQEWLLIINGETILKKNGNKSSLLKDFMQILNNWQEANQKPPCPLVHNQPSGFNVESQPSSSWSNSHSPGDYRGYGSGQQGSEHWQGRNYNRNVHY